MKTVTDAVREFGGQWPGRVDGGYLHEPFSLHNWTVSADKPGSYVCTWGEFEAEAERMGYRGVNRVGSSENLNDTGDWKKQWGDDEFPPIGWHGECTWGKRVSWHECVMLPNHNLAMARHSTTDSDWLVADIPHECEFRPIKTDRERWIERALDHMPDGDLDKALGSLWDNGLAKLP